jgi:phytol kinase
VLDFQNSQILPVWLSVGLILLYLLTLVVLAEFISHVGKKKPETTRKIVHIGSGHVVLLAWWFQIPAWIGVGASLVAGSMAIIAYFFPILPSINSVGRKSLGTLFYALSIGILIAYFWSIDHPEYAAIGVMIMTWGDGLAALIGQKYGKHPYQLWGINKSWEGSLTMFVVSFLVSTLILGGVEGISFIILLISLAIAFVATLLETVSWWGIDNLTVPLTSAFFCFFLLGTRCYNC